MPDWLELISALTALFLLFLPPPQSFPGSLVREYSLLYTPITTQSVETLMCISALPQGSAINPSEENRHLKAILGIHTWLLAQQGMSEAGRRFLFIDSNHPFYFSSPLQF